MSASGFSLELGKIVEVVLCRLSDNGQLNGSFLVELRWWDTITTVRNIIAQRTGIPNKQIDIIYEGKKLPKTIPLYQLNVFENRFKLFYYIRSSSERAKSWIRLISNEELDIEFLNAVDDVRNGFSLGIKPELSLYGSGGTYFLNDRDRWNLLVFKPYDEEPFAENNPRNFQGITGQSGFRKGIRSGEGWKREVAAYLLDRDHLFSVPTTVQSHIAHPAFQQKSHTPKFKVGSLQYFIADAEPVSDWSPSKFTTFEVQKIAFLDMYIMNLDRNDANILVKRKRNNYFHLIPIDHGYSIPDRFEVNELAWCWQDWKQVKEPWDDRLVNFAKKMDVMDDSRLLNENVGIRKICLIVLRICGILLKKGIENGLTAYEISQFYIHSEYNQNKPSIIEKIVQQCIMKVKSILSMKHGGFEGREFHRGNERTSIMHCNTMNDLSSENTECLTRILSTQSLSSITYSEEPYSFPPDIAHKLVHDKEYRHLFFTFYEESVNFWISSILHKHVDDTGIFIDSLIVCFT